MTDIDDYFICYHCRDGRHKSCVGVPCRCACDFPAVGIEFETRTDQLTRAVIALGNIAKGDLSAIDCAVMARICIQGLGDLPAAPNSSATEVCRFLSVICLLVGGLMFGIWKQ